MLKTSSNKNKNNNSISPSKSFSSLSNATGFSSSVDINDEARNYLPEFLANRKPAKIGSIDLHFTKLRDGRRLYTYTVDWKEKVGKNGVAQFRRKKSKSSKKSKNKSSQTSSSSARSKSSKVASPSPSKDAASETKTKKIQAKEKPRKSSQKQQKPGRSKIRSSASATAACCKQELRRCDGPCNRRMDIHDLTIIGLCDHVACEQCLANAPRIDTENFGGMGCPNVKCYLLDLASLCPDKEKRMETIRRAYLLESPVNSESTTSTVTFSTSMSIKTKKK